MNTYIAFWNGQETEVEATTTYEGLMKAITVFQAGTRRKVKSGQVAIMLAAKDGEPYTHTADV